MPNEDNKPVASNLIERESCCAEIQMIVMSIFCLEGHIENFIISTHATHAIGYSGILYNLF